MKVLASKQIVLLLAFAACGAATAEPLEIPLKLRVAKESVDQFIPPGFAGLQWTTECPKGEWTWPKLKTAHPLYAQLELGGKSHLFVLDAVKPKAALYDRLYFDANGNGDLTDDKPADTVSLGRGTSTRAEFPPQETVLEPGARRYVFSVSLYAYPDEDRETSPAFPKLMISGYLRALCAYSGSFKLDGKTYHVLLGDARVNGVFSDTLSVSSTTRADERVSLDGDVLYLTETNHPSHYDGMTLADHVFVGGILYRAEVNPEHTSMRLTPVEEPLIPVALAAEADLLLIREVNKKRTVFARAPGSAIQLPSGRYSVVAYQLNRKAADGSVWRLSASAAKGAAEAEVEPEKPAKLVFGEPYSVKVHIPPWSLQQAEAQEDASLRLNFQILGVDGEMVGDLSCVSGRSKDIPMAARDVRRPKEPAYTIAREDGEMVDRGVFEYG